MNAQLSQASYIDSSVLGGSVSRLAAATSEASKAAVATFQAVWREQSGVTDRARSVELMMDVNDRVLKDIGAPDWMIARANERRHSHHIHLLELFRS